MPEFSKLIQIDVNIEFNDFENPCFDTHIVF